VTDSAVCIRQLSHAALIYIWFNGGPVPVVTRHRFIHFEGVQTRPPHSVGPPRGSLTFPTLASLVKCFIPDWVLVPRTQSLFSVGQYWSALVSRVPTTIQANIRQYWLILVGIGPILANIGQYWSTIWPILANS